MGVYTINISNLSDDLTAMDELIVTAESNKPTVIDDLFDSMYKLDSSQDCSTFYFTDDTVYDSIDTNNLTISVDLVYKDDCGEVVSECYSGIVFQPNRRLTLPNEFGDGQYCARVHLTYVDPDPDTGGTYTDTKEYCLIQSCCNNKIVDLHTDVVCRMNKIVPKILSYCKIGRDASKLWNSLYALKNIHHVLCNVENSCDDYEDLASIVAGIKNNNC